MSKSIIQTVDINETQIKKVDVVQVSVYSQIEKKCKKHDAFLQFVPQQKSQSQILWNRAVLI